MPATLSLENRVAVVTGGSRGIGKAAAMELASRGASVVVNYNRSPEAAEEVVRQIQAQGGKAAAFQADVSDFKQAEALIRFAVETFGDLSILVNNAGITRDQLIMLMPEADWDAVHRHQPEKHLQLLEGRRQTHDAQTLRAHHQYRLGGRTDGQPRADQLFGLQSRTDRLHQGAGARSGCPQHHCQCHRARICGYGDPGCNVSGNLWKRPSKWSRWPAKADPKRSPTPSPSSLPTRPPTSPARFWAWMAAWR